MRKVLQILNKKSTIQQRAPIGTEDHKASQDSQNKIKTLVAGHGRDSTVMKQTLFFTF